MTVESIQAGLQGGILPLVPQLLVETRRYPQKYFSGILADPASSKICHLDLYCGVLLSLHTGVMRRVRLRDMVAHLASSNLVAWDYDDEILALLQSDSDPLTWCKTSKAKASALTAVTNAALARLKYSGFDRDKHLHVGWGSSEELPISQKDQDWVAALANTQITTTYAEVVQDCHETPERACHARSAPKDTPAPDWQFPERLRLKTTVSVYKTQRGHTLADAQPVQLREGKSYFVNDPRLGIIGKVIGSTGSASAGGTAPVYYLSARKSSIKWLRRYLPSHGSIRESWGGLEPVGCVVGSGKGFERLVNSSPIRLCSSRADFESFLAVRCKNI